MGVGVLVTSLQLANCQGTKLRQLWKRVGRIKLPGPGQVDPSHSVALPTQLKDVFRASWHSRLSGRRTSSRLHCEFPTDCPFCPAHTVPAFGPSGQAIFGLAGKGSELSPALISSWRPFSLAWMRPERRARPPSPHGTLISLAPVAN